MLDEKGVEPLRQFCRRMLRRELGLARVQVDEHGALSFHFERLWFVLRFDPHIPGMIWLSLPSVFVVGAMDAHAATRMDAACNDVNRDFKIVKVTRRTDVNDRGDWVVDAALDFVVTRIDALDADLLEFYLMLLKRARRGIRRAFESTGKQTLANTIATTMPGDAVVH